MIVSLLQDGAGIWDFLKNSLWKNKLELLREVGGVQAV